MYGRSRHIPPSLSLSQRNTLQLAQRGLRIERIDPTTDRLNDLAKRASIPHIASAKDRGALQALQTGECARTDDRQIPNLDEIRKS